MDKTGAGFDLCCLRGGLQRHHGQKLGCSPFIPAESWIWLAVRSLGPMGSYPHCFYAYFLRETKAFPLTRSSSCLQSLSYPKPKTPHTNKTPQQRQPTKLSLFLVPCCSLRTTSPIFFRKGHRGSRVYISKKGWLWAGWIWVRVIQALLWHGLPGQSRASWRASLSALLHLPDGIVALPRHRRAGACGQKEALSSCGSWHLRLRWQQRGHWRRWLFDVEIETRPRMNGDRLLLCLNKSRRTKSQSLFISNRFDLRTRILVLWGVRIITSH